MTNCTLLQTTEAILCRKPFKVSEPAMIDVTPVATAPALTRSSLPVATPGTTLPALRAPAPLAFLEVKPKARRASKKTTAQSLVELLIAAASLLFLAMT